MFNHFKIPFLFASQKTGMTAFKGLILNKKSSLQVLPKAGEAIQ